MDQLSTVGKLLAVQAELKAPKGQYNSFGKYKYRSCEDILEAVKPILKKYGAIITVSDELVQIGNRFYVKAIARFWNADETVSQTRIENMAYAREPDSKKGMDESQITGTASSYARKYALNGLLLIDDTKDADTDENRNEREARSQKKEPPKQEQPKQAPPGYPEIEQMVNDIAAYIRRDKRAAEHIENAMKEVGARDIAELAFMSESFIAACWQKWIQKKG